jgi:hypothetical protein
MVLSCATWRRKEGALLRPAGVVLVLGLLALSPAVAMAETDRLTVEDPSTGAVKFKVTSDGNVTGALFTGDGAALTNVPHFKGAWSSVTAYAKDDCVNYGGSSFIALAASTSAQPDVTPASWAVLAAQGSAGAAGSTGPAGPQGTAGANGPQGIQGIQGPAGSPDTQAQILTKITTQTDGALLAVKKGPAEDNSTVKFAVNDGTNNKFSVQAKGIVAIGNTTATNPLTIDTNSTAVGQIVGSAAILVSGDVNYEKFEIRSSLQPTFTGRNSAGTVTSPLATTSGKILFSLAGGGHDGAAWTAQNPSLISMVAEELFTPTAHGANILFHTTAPGGILRSEKMRVTGNGNVGIGTTVPTQKLEVNGGVRINTATAKPACDSTVRGTFWFTQGAAGAKDAVEVCAMDAANSFGWRQLW